MWGSKLREERGGEEERERGEMGMCIILIFIFIGEGRGTSNVVVLWTSINEAKEGGRRKVDVYE